MKETTDHGFIKYVLHTVKKKNNKTQFYKGSIFMPLGG